MSRFSIDNLAGLNRSLDKLTKQVTEVELVKVHKKTVFDLLAGVVLRTPVDEGAARANWQVGIGSPISGATSGVDKDDTLSSPTIQNGLGQVSGLEPFSVVFVTNNLPHTIVLDQGLFDPPNPGPSKDKRPDREGIVLVENGFSTQAPQGMVDATIAQMAQGFKL